ncbi:serine/threonine protein kinase [Bordetella sp. H567]|uniref:serine/threonine protein kinase n=1 Tax=Bordetella sp. H567 TaxID=1697043 RepID=UPI0011AB31AF|nr:serine/threonine protein kinase [Bordetella sp. H567]
MSVSPAFMPGAEHPAPEPFGYRPLAAIAAAAAGGVPQKRIGRVVSEIAPELMAAHGQGKVHGAISVQTVGLDEFGYAHVMVPVLYPDHPRAMEPASCFAAVEQFDPDPVQACGPWTDVYGLCAVMCSLVSGSPPPHALARRVEDQYVTLATRRPRGYDEAFLAVIDQGLSLDPALRPQSIADLCGMLGISCVPETQEDGGGESEHAAAAPIPRHAAGQRRGGAGARRWLVGMITIAAGVLAAACLWAWMSQDDARDDLLARRAALASRATGYSGPSGAERAGQDAAASGRVSAGAPGPGQLDVGDDDDAGRSPDPQSLAVPPRLQGPPAAPVESASPGAAPNGPAANALAPEAGGAPAARAVRPATVAVKVDIQPWGEIFIDGVSRGISPPVKSLNLPVGRHTVEVRNAGLAPYRASLEVKAGQPAVIRHVF